jgi:ubiquinone/menaquinone biosynthesis C-methylase UbiE
MSTIEAAHYENPELWKAERYIGDAAELRRFDTCLHALPGDTRSLLDVGTGNGAFLRVVEESGRTMECRGLERSAAAISSRLCQAPIDAGGADDLPYEDGSFDVVSALEVIEHLPFGVYEKALIELARVARQHVLISVPFREYRLRVHCPYCACEFNPHYHMRRFDETVMTGLIPGFRLAELIPVEVADLPLGSVVKPVYRWIRQRMGFYPSHAICPQCGYTRRAASASAAAPASLGRRTAQAESLGRRVRRLVPSVKRPVWAVGLYTRGTR